MYLVIIIIVAVIGVGIAAFMGYKGSANPFSRGHKLEGAVDEELLTEPIFAQVGVDQSMFSVNAIVMGCRKICEAHLPECKIDELSNGMYTYGGKPIIIIEQNPEDNTLKAWEEQHHPIDDALPECVTPQALEDTTEWKQAVSRYFGLNSTGIAAFNKGIMIAIVFGLAFFAYLLYSSHIEG